MESVFTIINAYVGYGDCEVIHGVSLSIKEGEFCALLGLNGSGKTTLLHGACGFLPLQGEVLVNNQNTVSINEKKRAQLISFIPQMASLSGGRSVLDVVLMGFNAKLRLLESPHQQHYDIARKTLQELGLSELEERDFGSLSGGQKQLVIFARTLVQDAPVMLMDEPDSALDFLNRHKMLGLIRTSLKKEKRAGLITLHDPNFAMMYCDRLFLMKEGKIVDELVMAGTKKQTIKDKLSQIYESIEIVSCENGYLMTAAMKGAISECA